MKSGRLLASFLLVATGLRWWLNFGRPLSMNEAYLALCGSFPSIAYFEGPGGVSWLAALGISLVGPNAFGATLFWPLLAALASIALYKLTANLTTPHEALLITVFLNFLPSFNHATLNATATMPLAATALGTSLFAWLALEKNNGSWWFLAGLCAALGLLFSYAALLFLPTLALIQFTSHRWRRNLLSPRFWLAWLAPLIVLSLLLHWNSRFGWVHFIGGTWTTALTLNFSLLPPFLFSAIRNLSPLVFVALCAAWGATLPHIRVSPKVKFLALPALAALLITLYLTLQGAPANAMGLTTTALMLPLLAWLPTYIFGISRRNAFALVLVSAALFSTAAVPHPDQAFITPDAAQQVKALQSTHTSPNAPPPFLIAQNAPLAAALALAIPDLPEPAPGHPRAFTLESADARSQFDLWPRYDQFLEAPHPATPDQADPFTEQEGVNPFLGRSALYITTEAPDELPQAITAAFTTVQPLDDIPMPDGHTLHAYLCTDYQTMPL